MPLHASLLRPRELHMKRLKAIWGIISKSESSQTFSRWGHGLSHWAHDYALQSRLKPFLGTKSRGSCSKTGPWHLQRPWWQREGKELAERGNQRSRKHGSRGSFRPAYLCVGEARGAWGMSEPDSRHVSRKQCLLRGSVLIHRPVIQKKQIIQMSACLLLIFFLNVYNYCSVWSNPEWNLSAGQICAVNHMSDSCLKCTSPWSQPLAIGAWRRKSPLQAALGWMVDVSGRR